jgi:hypothetical protein
MITIKVEHCCAEIGSNGGSQILAFPVCCESAEQILGWNVYNPSETMDDAINVVLENIKRCPYCGEVLPHTLDQAFLCLDKKAST